MTDKYYTFVNSNDFDHNKLTGNQAKFVEYIGYHKIKTRVKPS